MPFCFGDNEMYTRIVKKSYLVLFNALTCVEPGHQVHLASDKYIFCVCL